MNFLFRKTVYWQSSEEKNIRDYAIKPFSDLSSIEEYVLLKKVKLLKINRLIVHHDSGEASVVKLSIYPENFNDGVFATQPFRLSSTYILLTLSDANEVLEKIYEARIEDIKNVDLKNKTFLNIGFRNDSAPLTLTSSVRLEYSAYG